MFGGMWAGPKTDLDLLCNFCRGKKPRLWALSGLDLRGRPPPRDTSRSCSGPLSGQGPRGATLSAGASCPMPLEESLLRKFLSETVGPVLAKHMGRNLSTVYGVKNEPKSLPSPPHGSTKRLQLAAWNPGAGEGRFSGAEARVTLVTKPLTACLSQACR